MSQYFKYSNALEDIFKNYFVFDLVCLLEHDHL